MPFSLDILEYVGKFFVLKIYAGQECIVRNSKSSYIYRLYLNITNIRIHFRCVFRLAISPRTHTHTLTYVYAFADIRVYEIAC